MAGTYFRVIKAGRLKLDVVRLELLNAARKVGTQVKQDYEACVETWTEHKPEFEVLVSAAGGAMTMAVEPRTNATIFGYVDKGTGMAAGHLPAPYPIWAGWYTGKSEHKTLAFPSVFTPKTKPRVIGSGPGASGGEKVFTPYVEHPGIEPRKFTETIVKKRKDLWKKELKNALARGIRKSLKTR